MQHEFKPTAFLLGKFHKNDFIKNMKMKQICKVSIAKSGEKRAKIVIFNIYLIFCV